MPITQKQREARVKSIGASDAPIILGVSPYADANVGNLFYQKHPDGLEALMRAGGALPDFQSKAMGTGARLENVLLEIAEERLEKRIWRNQMRRCPEHFFMHANYDALETKAVPGFSVECKWSSREEGWGPDGSDQVPVHVMVQVQYQMGVWSLASVYVAAAIGMYHGIDWRMFPIPRDQEMIDWIFAACIRFWQEHVVPRKPPEGWAVPPLAILQERYREPQKTVEISPRLIDNWLATQAAAKFSAKDAKIDYAAVVDALGDAEAGECEAGRVTYLEQVQRRVDTTALRRDGLYEEYSAPGKPFRKLLWKAAKALPEPEKQECLP